MIKRAGAVLLSLSLGVAGVLLLTQLSTTRNDIFAPSNRDLVIGVITLSLGVFAALAWLSAEMWEWLRQQQIDQARQEVFAEHRRFLRRLDHEMKNPLMALRAGLSSLSLTMLSQEQQHLIQTMEQEIIRLGTMVADLRKLAEIENIPLEVSLLHPFELLHEAALLFYDRAQQQQKTLTIEPVTNHIPAFYGDHDLLLLALHNLLDNALKYTMIGDRIWLKASEKNGFTTLHIGDTGCGIPEPEQSMVWEELYRGQAVTGVAGKGIGLALVKAIVERHYGQVGLVSQQHGIEVILQLPHE